MVYIKVIDEATKLIDTEYHIRKVLPKGRLRAVIRPQAGAPGISGLYIYAHTATMEQAEKRLMQMLREEDPSLTPVEIHLNRPYRSETDTMRVLYALGSAYEPVKLFRLFRRRHRDKKSS